MSSRREPFNALLRIKVRANGPEERVDLLAVWASLVAAPYTSFNIEGCQSSELPIRLVFSPVDRHIGIRLQMPPGILAYFFNIHPPTWGNFEYPPPPYGRKYELPPHMDPKWDLHPTKYEKPHFLFNHATTAVHFLSPPLEWGAEVLF